MADPVTKIPLSPGQRHRLNGLAEQRAQVLARMGQAAADYADAIDNGRKALAAIAGDVHAITKAARAEAEASGAALAKGVWAHVGADLILVQPAAVAPSIPQDAKEA